MTSRPPLAVSQRQPQRSISGSGLSQRPAHQQRSLSQQYLPQSPIRRSDSYNDQPAESGDHAQNRFGPQPRRGGSRLKLELANDGIDHAGFSESPQNLDPISANKVFTPSRVMSMNDASDFGDASPHPSRSQQPVDGDSAPLPMPPRRARFVIPARRPAPSTISAPPKKDSRPKPFILEPPSDAPRYSTIGKQESPGKHTAPEASRAMAHANHHPWTGYADFQPWRGGHTEDQFSDYVIRHGFFDKAPAQSSQEGSSAKVPIFPALKHKSGLHTLSNIFTGILNQRRHSGQITSPSTFKPPPRVTLTDTKREVWIKDLANPAISLRRLSRTIPHGIRGRVLLDQCLNKGVPTDRAVWLAKCVGANEIRAFKRKGVNNTFVMGGEVKWIRDWTLCVEQFVEFIVSAYTDNEWKAKVTYAIRLATHLYAEHLLDRDHYMDWLVSGLENSNQAKLPMWMLIVQIYWKDILKLRKYGRRLVTAILHHHCSIYNHPDRDILLPLSTQLSSLVDSIISTCPESFVHPGTWTRFRDTLQSSLATKESKLLAFKSIDARNDYLTSSNVKSQPAVRSTLVESLDNMLRMPFTGEIPAQLRKPGESSAILVRTVLEWCTSLYRFGVAKVYIATSILRSLSALDVDITRGILDFLDADSLPENARRHLVYHLVSELVRSGHFSVPQYVQWLIARGGLTEPTQAQPDGPCATRLLVELPISSLSDSMRSLRATLLRRASFLVDDEASDISTAIKCIKHLLSVPLEPTDPILQRAPMTVKKLAKRIGLSSRCLKSQVSSWLCNEYIEKIAQNLRSVKGGVGISNTTFETVRTLLEAAQDFTMLENTLQIVAQSSNAEILAYCTDTINLHLPVFAAIGSAKTLFQALYDRLKVISEEQGIGARPLLASLTHLASRLPGFEQKAAQLQNDLIRADRSSAVDASSPLSDNMATQLQDADAELSEQIEKLASYTSADRPTMERLFQAIIIRLESCWGKADERQRACCLLLSRLRVFDTQHFDTLMRGWILRIRKLTKRPPISSIFPLLISSGCLSLAILFETAPRSQTQTAQLQSSPVGSASVYMQEVLQLLMMPLTPNQVVTSEDCYRFRIIQERTRLEHAKEVMPLIRGALAEYAASRNQQPPRPQPLDDEKVRAHLLELLRTLILVDPNAASQTMSLKSPDAKLAALIETLTTKLLVPHGGGGQKSFEQVLELANEFTLPFCQVKLSLNLATDESSTPEGAERLQSQFELLSKAMDNAIDANNIMWTGMHLKNRAEAKFLEILPSLKNPPLNETVSNDDIRMAENLLTVIDSVLRGGPASKTSLSSAMVDKLADLWEILSSTSEEYASLKAAVLSHWLPLLLSYLALQASPLPSPADVSKLPGSEVRARALIILAGIVQELDNHPTTKLGEHALDIALVLADHLAEDARLQCVRALKDCTSDPRIRYLFSFAPNPAENFMLAHRDKPLAPPPGAGIQEQRRAAAMAMGMNGGMLPERLTPFTLRRWELLNEPTANVGENDTSLSLTLFDARKI
ncbi:transcription mediator subunit Med12 [Biscogniauxia mediterranea]|nr:transcription mediator subunit Med12 [Biscogniauxia mediterranea]